MDSITAQFLNNPLVAPIYALLVVCLVDFALGVYRSIQAGVFDWQKLPQVLDTAVLQKVLPLAALGVASFFVTDPAGSGALTVAYLGLAAAALAAEVRGLIAKVTGSYVATPASIPPALGS